MKLEYEIEHRTTERSRLGAVSGWAKLALTFFRACMLSGGVLYLADANHVKSPFHALIGFLILWLWHLVSPIVRTQAPLAATENMEGESQE